MNYFDIKVDIWAIGCVLYHLGSLEPPFKGDNLISLGYSIVHKNPKPLPTAYSTKLTSFIMKLLEKNAQKRPKISDIKDIFPLNLQARKTKTPTKENSKNEIKQFVELKSEMMTPPQSDFQQISKGSVYHHLPQEVSSSFAQKQVNQSKEHESKQNGPDLHKDFLKMLDKALVKKKFGELEQNCRQQAKPAAKKTISDLDEAPENKETIKVNKIQRNLEDQTINNKLHEQHVPSIQHDLCRRLEQKQALLPASDRVFSRAQKMEENSMNAKPKLSERDALRYEVNGQTAPKNEISLPLKEPVEDIHNPAAGESTPKQKVKRSVVHAMMNPLIKASLPSNNSANTKLFQFFPYRNDKNLQVMRENISLDGKNSGDSRARPMSAFLGGDTNKLIKFRVPGTTAANTLESIENKNSIANEPADSNYKEISSTRTKSRSVDRADSQSNRPKSAVGHTRIIFVNRSYEHNSMETHNNKGTLRTLLNANLKPRIFSERCAPDEPKTNGSVLKNEIDEEKGFNQMNAYALLTPAKLTNSNYMLKDSSDLLSSKNFYSNIYNS